jgi:hypothetical protein
MTLKYGINRAAWSWTVCQFLIKHTKSQKRVNNYQLKFFEINKVLTCSSTLKDETTSQGITNNWRTDSQWVWVYWCCVLLVLCVIGVVCDWCCVWLVLCVIGVVCYWCCVLLVLCVISAVCNWRCVLLVLCIIGAVCNWCFVLLVLCVIGVVCYSLTREILFVHIIKQMYFSLSWKFLEISWKSCVFSHSHLIPNTI